MALDRMKAFLSLHLKYLGLQDAPGGQGRMVPRNEHIRLWGPYPLLLQRWLLIFNMKLPREYNAIISFPSQKEV